MIAAVAWLLIRSVNILEDFLSERFRIDVADNLQARKIHTQLRVIKRIVTVIVVIIALGTMLMTFDRVRQLGTSILASAGIVGIIAGLAAQRSLATLFAGMQIAITQPVRIDDVVIVEGEWGRIEEITLTYVVLRIWDLRRLIVPITYFIEKPFQNWTRVSADILGSVFLYLDYEVPLDVIRKEFMRLLEMSDYWDKKVGVVQVTNTSEKAIEVRLLMSAHDAGTAWNLRCQVREKMIQFVQKNYPDSLPQVRAQFKNNILPGKQ
jgi:small-conductance mechanosensitive channel